MQNKEGYLIVNPSGKPKKTVCYLPDQNIEKVKFFEK